MSKVNQKEAVYTAVSNVLSEEGITPTDGFAVELSKEARAQVATILFEGFRAGTIELNREFTDAELKAYVSSLQSNWLRKDTRLNGGIAYVAKNPGSRAGTGDPGLKAMKALLNSLTSDEDKAEVQEHINARLAELQVSKIKTAVIDYSVLPADLAAKFATKA